MHKHKSEDKKILKLSYFTVVYNIIEGLVSVLLGSHINAISLIGFGFDSFIESLSGGVVIWKTRKGATNAHDDPIEVKAIRLISYTFFVLAAYVLYQSVQKLVSRQVPEQSWFGIVIAIISIVVMFVLYLEKRHIGLSTHNRALIADSKQTLACIWMSVVLLAGLGLNHFFGFWWSDALGGMAISALLFKEGFETYQLKHLCDC